MKIFFICPQVSGRGGMETVTSQFIKVLQQRMHTVYLILVKRSNFPEWERELPVFHLLKEEKAPIHIGNSILELMSELGTPDVAITMSAKITAVTRRAFNHLQRRPPIISWIHLSLKESSGATCIRMADAHIAISEGIKQEILNLDKDHPIYLLNNPINLPEKSIKRSDVPTFVFIGRLVFNPKRPDKLLNALESFKQQDWKLIIIGDGTYRKNLEEMAYLKNIHARIKWLGWVENPWSLIMEATALIVTSDYEAYPLVIIEALSHGLPVISSNCPTGPREMIHHGNNGWLYKTEDLDELRSHLHKIIFKEVDLPNDKTCRESVAHLNINLVIDKFENILTSVLVTV